MDAAQRLAHRLGMRITRVVRERRANGNWYSVDVEGTRVEIGKIPALTSQTVFRRRILDCTSRYVTWHNRAEWDATIELLFEVMDTIEACEERTAQGQPRALKRSHS